MFGKRKKKKLRETSRGDEEVDVGGLDTKGQAASQNKNLRNVRRGRGGGENSIQIHMEECRGVGGREKLNLARRRPRYFLGEDLRVPRVKKTYWGASRTIRWIGTAAAQLDENQTGGLGTNITCWGDTMRVPSKGWGDAFKKVNFEQPRTKPKTVGQHKKFGPQEEKKLHPDLWGGNGDQILERKLKGALTTDCYTG